MWFHNINHDRRVLFWTHLYLFGKFKTLVIEIKSKIGHGCILNAWKSIPKIASFIVVYLVGINSQSHTAVHSLKINNANCHTILNELFQSQLLESSYRTLVALNTYPFVISRSKWALLMLARRILNRLPCPILFLLWSFLSSM